MIFTFSLYISIGGIVKLLMLQIANPTCVGSNLKLFALFSHLIDENVKLSFQDSFLAGFY
jgi:hypothetical protein